MTLFSSAVTHLTRKPASFCALAALTFSLLTVAQPALAEPKPSPTAEITSISVTFEATADQMAASLNNVVGRDLYKGTAYGWREPHPHQDRGDQGDRQRQPHFPGGACDGRQGPPDRVGGRGRRDRHHPTVSMTAHRPLPGHRAPAPSSAATNAKRHPYRVSDNQTCG
jgi:hypothetical protein